MREKKRRIVLFTGIVLVSIAIFKIATIMWDYYTGDSLYKETEETYVKKQKQEAPNWKDMITVDIDSLKKVNDDIVGWIFFENEDISYPILYSGDNEQYLRLGYDGESFSAGSIFVDGGNHPDFSDAHTIVYGHNMKNLSMFGRLKYYITQDGYYDKHKYFQIITENRKYRYEIFAYKKVNEQDEIYTIYPVGDDDFLQFVENHIVNDAQVNNDVAVGAEDKVVTLSTCTVGEGRLVISAVLVEEFVE